jgi:hypothetical protein
VSGAQAQRVAIERVAIERTASRSNFGCAIDFRRDFSFIRKLSRVEFSQADR